ncbi:YesK-like family protein [Bacillus subtilis]|uniref:YesK-like family protein n=1 Tax=Bacillus subtilis TaxID=1423 RepID=UPI0007AF49BA|nr:YesK-like family protein [Bacillus subtilis]MDX7996621.1 YesK-like family protein [Bacillus subtilis]
MSFLKGRAGDVWPILFVTGICDGLSAGVSVLMRMRFLDKSRPEWMLAVLIVLGMFAIWYSLVYVRGWEGAALGMLGFNVIFGAIAGYLVDKAIRRDRKR